MGILCNWGVNKIYSARLICESNRGGELNVNIWYIEAWNLVKIDGNK